MQSKVQGSMVISTMANANIILNSILLKLNKGSILWIYITVLHLPDIGVVWKDNDTIIKL